jgi:hypothetical protein
MNSSLEDLNSEKEAAFIEHADTLRKGIVGEFLDFLLHNKKWWLAPIMICLLLLGALVLLGGSSVAPFIYALF